ncbi:MAG: hypothetical protein HY761_01680 [Candidatus Omnitrophica bacterium]|nr:hypothetical protein [Candidatus Omnitrophota bacterium]
MKKVVFVCFSFFSFFLVTVSGFASGFERFPFEAPPAPEIIIPRSDEVDLTGKDSLECKWISLKPAEVDHFELKLYKGYNMYESGLMFSENAPSDKNFLLIKAETFEQGQVYTICLRQISYGGEKSDKAFVSFKIIGK